MLFLLLACSSSNRSDNGCPDGMARVGEALCIDRYEVQVHGAKGHRDQYARPGATATATSTAGVIPSSGVSFSQAMRICENVGKRLPEAHEWEDAGDGVVGQGGRMFPYGNTWDAHVCVSGSEGFTEAQPSGSKPRCVSPFGVYDQVGNLWEWTIGAGRIDVQGWLEKNNMREVDGLITTNSRPQRLFVQGTPVAIDDTGVLYLPLGADWTNGYLRTTRIATTAEQLLPVDLVREADRLVLRLHPDGDGGLVPDKRGCGYYTFGSVNCSLDKSGVGDHFHDHDGTIGFRCAVSL